LRELAGGKGWRRPRKRSLFAEGLKLLSNQYGIWLYYKSGEGERVISIKEWLPKHESWVAEGIKERIAYEKVWKYANRTIGDPKDKPIPPMPKIKLPSINS
jgi:hypothetical protein